LKTQTFQIIITLLKNLLEGQMNLLFKFFQFLAIITVILVIQTISTLDCFPHSFQSKTFALQNETSQNDTYTVRVFHDGFWWLQVYDTDSDHFISEYLDPDQT
jgi:hypothetical protein